MNPKVNYLNSQRGATLVLIAIVIVVLLGVCALVVDLGVAYVATAQLQNTADAAALAGAEKLREDLNFDDARMEAISIAAANTVLKDSQILNPIDVKIGSWDDAAGKIVTWDETKSELAVQVTARRTANSSNGPVPTFFAKIWGRDHIDVSRTAIAGLNVTRHTRAPVNVMIVQDASTSFQHAWSKAIEANIELLKLINGVSVDGDAAGMVAFNGRLDPTWLKNSSSYRYLYEDYVNRYPEMNQGIKYTTDGEGRPKKTTIDGTPSNSGAVRPMTSAMTPFEPDASGTPNLPTALDRAGKLMKNGLAWGDTDTAAGLNYAIDQLLARGASAGNVIVLVSDGKPNDVRGSSYTKTRERQAVAAADRAERAGIKIHAVTLEGTNGANFKFNEGLIRGGGVGLRAASADDLQRLLIGIGTIEIGVPRLIK